MLQLGFKLNPIKIAQEYTLGVLRFMDYLLILYSFQRLLGKKIYAILLVVESSFKIKCLTCWNYTQKKYLVNHCIRIH
jgi:hypothetical protein